MLLSELHPNILTLVVSTLSNLHTSILAITRFLALQEHRLHTSSHSNHELLLGSQTMEIYLHLSSLL